MAWLEVIWDLEDDPDGNIQHIAEHGLSQDEVEEVLNYPTGHDKSNSSGRPIAFGYTSTGKFIAVIYEEFEAAVLYPVTAFETEEPI